MEGDIRKQEVRGCNSLIYQVWDFPVGLVLYFLQSLTHSNHSIKFCWVKNMEVICKYLKGDNLFLEFYILAVSDLNL